jgi:hypothetical protein
MGEKELLPPPNRSSFSLMTGAQITDIWPLQVDETHCLPPSILPVVILKGSNYTMGYQYGQQAGKYIELEKNTKWVEALKEIGTREKVLRELRGYQYYIKKDTPEAIEMMRGIADGATAAGCAVSYTDVLLINSYWIRKLAPTGAYSSIAKDDKMPPEGCTNWSAWGKTTFDGKLITGDSHDRYFGYRVTIVAFPSTGNRYIILAHAGSLGHHPAVNNKGVFFAQSGGFGQRDEDYDYGLPYGTTIQHLVRFSNSASEAEDILMPWKVAWSQNIHVSDVKGNAFIVEATAALKRVRRPGEFGETDFIYSTNNFFTDEMKEAMNGDKRIKHAGWQNKTCHWNPTSITRNLQLWNLLHNYSGKVDLNFAKMMFRIPGNSPPYPFDKKVYQATQANGWDQKICNRGTAWVCITQPDNGNNGVMHICTGPAGRIAYPLIPDRRAYSFQIAGTHTFYELSLASCPEEVASAAEDSAHDSIGEAYRQLMKLNYADTVYLGLNALYSQAVTEYYSGINEYNKGFLASENEALFYFAQATTYFARAQAHAGQVHDALVPPATSPDGLGLTGYE